MRRACRYPPHRGSQRRKEWVAVVAVTVLDSNLTTGGILTSGADIYHHTLVRRIAGPSDSKTIADMHAGVAVIEEVKALAVQQLVRDSGGG